MRSVAWVVVCLTIASGSAFGQSVGVTSAVNQSAVGIPPSQKPKTIFMGEQIIHNEKITTDSKGLLQILLADGTSFTVGPNSSMSIDSFVYDPDAGSAKVVASLGKGVFRFIGGKSSKSPDGVTLNTPVGTVGVRGGISNLDFSGAMAYHVDMIYGDGVTLKNGTNLLGNIYHSGYSIVIGADGKVGIEKTPPGWTALFQSLMAGQGSGGSVSSTQVASTLSQKNTPPPKPNPGPHGSPPPTITDGPDGSKVVVPDAPLPPPSPFTTWAQIDSSSLANVTATYKGSYSGTVAFTNDNRGGSSEIPATIDNLPFELVYSFGLRGGTAYFAESKDNIRTDPILAMPVTADSLSGAATFSHSGTFAPADAQPSPGNIGTGTLNGFFLNTPDGTARGVGGSFDATVTDSEDGGYHIGGAFAGNSTPPN